MNTEVKTKWLEALRSGKYDQGRTALRRRSEGRDEFCCLGVLCDIVAPEEWEEQVRDELYIYHRGNNGGLPDDSILRDVDMTEVEARTLSRMNDDGTEFVYIANFIEQEF